MTASQFLPDDLCRIQSSLAQLVERWSAEYGDGLIRHTILRQHDRDALQAALTPVEGEVEKALPVIAVRSTPGVGYVVGLFLHLHTDQQPPGLAHAIECLVVGVSSPGEQMALATFLNYNLDQHWLAQTIGS